jgi:hypothetical protein
MKTAILASLFLLVGAAWAESSPNFPNADSFNVHCSWGRGALLINTKRPYEVAVQADSRAGSQAAIYNVLNLQTTVYRCPMCFDFAFELPSEITGSRPEPTRVELRLTPGSTAPGEATGALTATVYAIAERSTSGDHPIWERQIVLDCR